MPGFSPGPTEFLLQQEHSLPTRLPRRAWRCAFLQVGEHAARSQDLDGMRRSGNRSRCWRCWRLGWGVLYVVKSPTFHQCTISSNCQIRSFAAGEVFTILSDSSSERHWRSTQGRDNEANLRAWFESGPSIGTGLSYHPQPLWGGLQLSRCIVPGTKTERTIVLARAENAALLQQARESLRGTRANFLQSTLMTWHSGRLLQPMKVIWPAVWKNGWVYDLETLRMIVRRPIGISRVLHLGRCPGARRAAPGDCTGRA